MSPETSTATLTLTRAEAARINGAKSKGPVTLEGRARSSQNAIRHGLSAQAVVLHGEEPADFDQLRDSYMQTFRPANQAETDLVEALAAARWRLRRMPMLEVEVFENIHYKFQGRIEHELDECAPFNKRMGWVFIKSSEGCSPLNLLQRYEGQLNRTFDRSLKALQSLQKARLAAPPPELQNEPKPQPVSVHDTAPLRLETPPFPEPSPLPAAEIGIPHQENPLGAAHSDS